MLLVFLTATTTATATWAVLYNRIEKSKDELTTFQSSSSWKLLETLKALNEVSERARVTLEEREHQKTLSYANAVLCKNNSRFKTEVSSLQQKISVLEATNKTCLTKVQDFDVVKGQSIELAKNGPVFGVTEIDSIIPTVEINQPGVGPVHLSPGDSREIEYAGHRCFIRVKTIGENRATISGGCE